MIHCSTVNGTLQYRSSPASETHCSRVVCMPSMGAGVGGGEGEGEGEGEGGDGCMPGQYTPTKSAWAVL